MEEGYLTKKQEDFSVAVASGLTLSDSYREAGYGCTNPKTVNEAASRLLSNSKIAARVTELRKPAADKAQVTLEGHLNDLKEIRDKALQNSQFSAAVTAEIARGKATGLYVTKAEINNSVQFENMRTEELKQILMDNCKELGFTVLIER